MPHEVVDHQSHKEGHIRDAIRRLSSSSNRLAVFREVYRGRKALKTADEIATAIGLDRKQVLTHGLYLAKHGLVDQSAGTPVSYRKVQLYSANRDKILRAASDPIRTKKALASLGGDSASISIEKVEHMGDKYQVGQAGAVGRGAKAQDMNFQQIWNSGSIDAGELAKELATLRTHIRTTNDSVDADIELGRLAEAEQAASQGDGPKALSALKSVGKWVLDTARDIGVAIVASAITRAQM